MKFLGRDIVFSLLVRVCECLYNVNIIPMGLYRSVDGTDLLFYTDCMNEKSCWQSCVTSYILRNDISVPTLATMCEVSPSTLYSYLNATRHTPNEVINKIVKALGLNIEAATCPPSLPIELNFRPGEEPACAKQEMTSWYSDSYYAELGIQLLQFIEATEDSQGCSLEMLRTKCRIDHEPGNHESMAFALRAALGYGQNEALSDLVIKLIYSKSLCLLPRRSAYKKKAYSFAKESIVLFLDQGSSTIEDLMVKVSRALLTIVYFDPPRTSPSDELVREFLLPSSVIKTAVDDWAKRFPSLAQHYSLVLRPLSLHYHCPIEEGFPHKLIGDYEGGSDGVLRDIVAILVEMYGPVKDKATSAGLDPEEVGTVIWQ